MRQARLNLAQLVESRAKMDQHQVPFVPQEAECRAVLLFDGGQRGRRFVQNRRAVIARKGPPRSPAYPQHLVQNSRSFKGQRNGRNVVIGCMWGLLHIHLLLYRVRRMLESRSMYPDVHLVIQLQSLDQKITALDKEVAALPKHIAVIEKALESHLRKLEADKAALSANQKDRKRLEGDIQRSEEKISKLRDQMLGAKT